MSTNVFKIRTYSLKKKKLFTFDLIDWIDSRKDEISSTIKIKKQINLQQSHDHIKEKGREERKKENFSLPLEKSQQNKNEGEKI